jgi:DNA replication initiation complex subunit (GINS family)
LAAKITTELLFSKLQKEKTTGELTSLPSDFYLGASLLISELESSDKSEENEKQIENAKKMLASLKERRKQKLLTYLAFSKQLPQTVPEEEEALYNEIRQILTRGADSVKVSRLKVLSSVPEVLTSEGREIGPYKAGEVIELANDSDVEFIIKNKIAELLSQ